MNKRLLAVTIPALFACLGATQSAKSLLTLDEFCNAVDIVKVRSSPHGGAVVIETSRADWDANRFRSDLWLYRAEGPGSLVALTQSGHDRNPEWSPDGRWIAFLSDRSVSTETEKPAETTKPKSETPAQVYVIPVNGGEAFAVTRGDEEVHALAWSADSREIYFATRTPWTKEQQEAYKNEWKDAVQFRESERGDAIDRVEVASALHCAAGSGAKPCE